MPYLNIIFGIKRAFNQLFLIPKRKILFLELDYEVDFNLKLIIVFQNFKFKNPQIMGKIEKKALFESNIIFRWD